MIWIHRPARRRRLSTSSSTSSIRKAASMMIESLELRQLFAYSLASTITEPITPPATEHEPQASFGSSVATSGNLLLVGAPHNGESAGPGSNSAAYLYDISDPQNPSLVRTFTDPDQLGGDSFGCAVAIFSDGRIAISAPENHIGGTGKVFVYDNAADTTPAILIGDPNIGGPFRGFGGAIAQIGNSVFVTELDPQAATAENMAVRRYDVAPGTSGNVASTTSYIIGQNPSLAPALAVKDGKVLVTGLDGSVGTIYQIDPSTNTVAPLLTDEFNDALYGASLAVTGSGSLLVGSPGVNSVYEYTDGDNTADRTFVAPAGSGSERSFYGFGFTLTVSGNELLIGNYDASTNDDGMIEGEAYLYDLTSGNQLATFQSPTIDPGDDYSFAMAAIPDGYVITDPLDDGGVNNFDYGAVYLYTQETPPPTNQDPTASIGGPYSVNENGSVLLDASGSSDPDTGDVLTYAWDLDNDGFFDDATGATVNFSRDLPGSYPVSVQVSDGNGGVDTASTNVTVSDVAPTADAGADQSAVTSQTVNLSGSGANTSGDAITGYAWDLDNDGQFDDAFTATTSTSFSTTGAKTVRLQVTDDDGQTAIDTMIVNVTSSAVVGDTLYVGGGAGSDSVAIKKDSTGGGSTITSNGQNITFNGTHIVVYGGSGADTITVSPSANVTL